MKPSGGQTIQSATSSASTHAASVAPRRSEQGQEATSRCGSGPASRLNANSECRRSGCPYPCRSESGSAWWGATSSGIPPRSLRWSTASLRWQKTPEPYATCSGSRGTRGTSPRPTVSPKPDRRPVGRRPWRCLLEEVARSTLTNEQASLALPSARTYFPPFRNRPQKSGRGKFASLGPNCARALPPA